MAVKGIPVSIVETGFGTPVSPVEGNAPLMTVVETGFGTPISIVETGYGTPFVVQGYDPEPPENPFTAFTVTAGSGNEGDTGYYTTIYGSISDEPLDGYALVEFATRNADYTQIAFVGDCLDIVAGWVPIIDGVTIVGVISDWAFDGSNTSATWESTGAMTENEQYPITWEYVS